MTKTKHLLDTLFNELLQTIDEAISSGKSLDEVKSVLTEKINQVKASLG